SPPSPCAAASIPKCPGRMRGSSAGSTRSVTGSASAAGGRSGAERAPGALRWRGEHAPPTRLVDLAKPAYKLGMTEIKVGRRDYALNVKVTPERDVLKVRDTARAQIQVTDGNGKPAANGEIALAAVDEGLLELMDNKSWDILEALLGERPTEVM